jgi:hypothetical protein
MKSKTFDSRVAARKSKVQLAPVRDRATHRKELVEQFKNGWASAGAALQELHDGEYWKDTHTSWIAFCKDNFGISKTKLYEILKYTEVVGSLSKENQTKITHIDQALALLKAPEKERNKIVEKAENNGGLAADNLRVHVAKPARVKPPKSKPETVLNSGQSSSGNTESKPTKKIENKIFYDENEYPLPDEAIPWGKESERGKEVQEVLSAITKLKSKVVGGREIKGEYHWLKVTNSIADTFGSLFSLISEAKPYAVCTTCMGSPSLQPEGCNFCKNTGLISKWQWDTQSRKEVKDMMLRRAADLKKERENVH